MHWCLHGKCRNFELSASSTWLCFLNLHFMASHWICSAPQTQFSLCLVHSLSNVKVLTESFFANTFYKKKVPSAGMSGDPSGAWNIVVINTCIRMLSCLQTDVIHHRQNVGSPDVSLAKGTAMESCSLPQLLKQRTFFSRDCWLCLLLYVRGIAAAWKPFTAPSTVCKCCQYECALV